MKDLKMSLLGLPPCGKTVYINSLFFELQNNETGLTFTPSGIETTERVSNNITTLQSGSWLDPNFVDELILIIPRQIRTSV